MAASGLAYCVVLALAYSAATPSASLAPDFRGLERVFFGQEKPVSLVERLLEATEGPMNRAGTMRPAFTEKSIGWDSLVKDLTAEEKAKLLAQREGERLALLAWVRSGLSHEAYQADDFHPGENFKGPITKDYLVSGSPSHDPGDSPRVRIRSLVADRCATCHGENGRDEMARWIPLETYEDIQRKCQPEAVAVLWPPWLIASLAALLPLALLTGALCCLTAIPLPTRYYLAVLPIAAVVVSAASWLLGRPGTSSIYVLLGAAVVAAIGVLVQIVASLGDLFGQTRELIGLADQQSGGWQS